MSWLCPNCQQPLVLRDDKRGLTCTKHHFDYAKQGYVNLLMVDQKSSKNPGDSADMIQARHDFLSQGVYYPLVKQIASQIDNALNQRVNNEPDQVFSLLDSGCGEGYYSREIAALVDAPITVYAFDISKAAVKKAAGLYRQACAKAADKSEITAHFAVASSFTIPIEPKSIDVALSVFSPFDEQSVLNTLAPQGVLIRVLPGSTHLQELKTRIYRQAEPHKPPKPLSLFTKMAEQRVTFTANLTAADYTQLRAMTPFNFHGSKEPINHDFSEQQTIPMTCDFILEMFTHHDNR